MPKKPWYIDEYHTAKGTPYYPDDEKTVDCPVAVITPKSEELLNLFGRAGRVYDASGAALFGPSLVEWPIWAVDALETIRICEIRENNARVEAEMTER